MLAALAKGTRNRAFPSPGSVKGHAAWDRCRRQREGDSSRLDAPISIPELMDGLGLKSPPKEGKGRYYTLSGLVMWLSGQLPQTGDVLVWGNWRLEVVDLDGKRTCCEPHRFEFWCRESFKMGSKVRSLAGSENA